MTTGRQPLPLGAHGNIATRQLGPKRWQALCRYRDADGTTRRVRRIGATKTAAINELRKALGERHHTTGADLGPSSKVSEAAALWFERVDALAEAGDLAKNTPGQYRSAYSHHVEPALGELRLREMTVARCEVWQTAVRKSQGPSRTKTARTVLSGILGNAARLGAIPTNPARDLSRIPGAAKKAPRALTADERTAWLTTMEASPRAVRWDLPDLTRFMLATGVRIGEALAVSWDEVDFDRGTVSIAWHLVRVKGEGLLRVAGTKRGDGRLLALPSWAVSMLVMRRADPRSGWPVFPDSVGGWRDPSNTRRVLRYERDEAGFGWVTSHNFRKTVATILDEAGLSPRQTADVLGHADPSMTQKVYMQRGIAAPESAAALESMLDRGDS